MSLKSYIASRIALMIPMVLFLLTLVFILLRMLPGDPVLLHFEKGATPEAIAEMRHRLGMDKSLPEQFVDYLVGIFSGNLGLSMQDYAPVTQHLVERFPATLELALFSMLFASLFGIALGVSSAKNYGTKKDAAIRLFGIVTYAIPVFFLGMLFQYIFAFWLNILPTGRRFDMRYGDLMPQRITGLLTIDSLIQLNFPAFFIALRHLLLPSITLGLILCGIFVRLTRTNMLETLRADFVVAAQARGLPDSRVTYVYALKNAFLPILTMIGLQFAALLAGAVLTETTFSWNGIGTYLVERIGHRDYTAIQGTVVFFGLLVTLVTLVVDILYAALDPRIRL
ncbi:MAG: ABC transporter permease [Candidatus Thorarchaeota archaeon]